MIPTEKTTKPPAKIRSKPVGFQLRFPPDLHKTLRKHVLVEKEATVSINAFIVSAVKEKLSAEGIPITSLT